MVLQTLPLRVWVALVAVSTLALCVLLFVFLPKPPNYVPPVREQRDEDEDSEDDDEEYRPTHDNTPPWVFEWNRSLVNMVLHVGVFLCALEIIREPGEQPARLRLSGYSAKAHLLLVYCATVHAFDVMLTLMHPLQNDRRKARLLLGNLCTFVVLVSRMLFREGAGETGLLLLGSVPYFISALRWLSSTATSTRFDRADLLLGTTELFTLLLAGVFPSVFTAIRAVRRFADERQRIFIPFTRANGAHWFISVTVIWAGVQTLNFLALCRSWRWQQSQKPRVPAWIATSGTAAKRMEERKGKRTEVNKNE